MTVTTDARPELKPHVRRRALALLESPHPGALPHERSANLECGHVVPVLATTLIDSPIRCPLCSDAAARRLDATEARP